MLLGADLLALLLAREVVARALPAGAAGSVGFVIAMLAGLAALGCYRTNAHDLMAYIARATALGAALVTWGTFGRMATADVVWHFAAIWGVTAAVVIFARTALRRAVALVGAGERAMAQTLVIGAPDDAALIIEHPALGETSHSHLAGFFDPTGCPGDIGARLAQQLKALAVDTVVIAGPLDITVFSIVIDAAITAGCEVLALPRIPPSHQVRAAVVWRNGTPVVELTRPGRQGIELMIKRGIDIVGAAVGLVVLAPVLAVIALVIKWDSIGPAFYAHTRVGRGGRAFRMYKFRSMRAGTDGDRDALQGDSLYRDGRLFKMENDPRVTRVGRWLRRTSLDEVPQLWNVFRGDMSLVGPRPPVPGEVALYEARDYARFDVKPGMTGPWQVNGRNQIGDFTDVVRLERNYIRCWSLGLDFELLLRTIPAVLSGRGAL